MLFEEQLILPQDNVDRELGRLCGRRDVGCKTRDTLQLISAMSNTGQTLLNN